MELTCLYEDGRYVTNYFSFSGKSQDLNSWHSTTVFSTSAPPKLPHFPCWQAVILTPSKQCFCMLDLLRHLCLILILGKENIQNYHCCVGTNSTDAHIPVPLGFLPTVKWRKSACVVMPGLFIFVTTSEVHAYKLLATFSLSSPIVNTIVWLRKWCLDIMFALVSSL